MIPQRNAKYLCMMLRISILGVLLGVLSACGGGGGNQAADPTVVNKPIAYIKRPTPTDNANNPVSRDVSDPEAFNPGAHLMVKMTATVSAPEIDVTDAIIGDTGDVRDPAFSDDGTKLVFAMHKPDVNGQPPETWNIYEYDLTKPLSQAAGSENPWMLMDSSGTASAGDDIEPQFMPGTDTKNNVSQHGSIVFSSTRGSAVGFIQLDENTGQFPPTIEAVNSKRHAFNLHVMPNVPSASSPVVYSGDISQISFNMSDDLFPTIIRNIPNLQGRIMYSRWEHSPGKNQMTLYTMNPDGTDVQLLYGENSHKTGTNNSTIEFIQPRETLNGDVMVIARPFAGTFDGGDPVRIDVNDFIDNTNPVSSGTAGQAQTSLSNNTVVTSPGISAGGRYNSIFPLQDGTNRALVSYSLCYVNVMDPNTSTTVTKSCNDPSIPANANTTEAPPRYGIFLLDIGSNNFLPITPPEAGMYYTDVVAARDLSQAPYIPNSTADYASNHYGILNIRSVYDMDGSFDPMGSTVASLAEMADPKITSGNPASGSGLIQRPAMFLRIVKGVYLPDSSVQKFDASAYGVNRSQLMRQIIGYAPVDPDGSVHVKVPANVPLSFSVLDKNGRRIGNRHGFWLTVRPGGTLTCAGCHAPNSNVPHGRTSVEPPGINPGATATEAANNMFVDTVSTFIVNQGDTMAMARTQTAPKAGQPNPLLPSPDIIYNDVWTDTNVRAKDTPFSYLYSDLNTTSPTNSHCASWDQSCRITINYESDIQPIWSWARTDAAGNDVTCTSCHHAPDNVNPPDGQLDLTNNPSTANAKRFVSYQDLLTTHDQVDATGAVVNSGQLDANGNPIPLTSPNSMVAGSATSSTTFIDEFKNTAGVTTPHCTVDTATNTCVPWLTQAEMKLILEWLDIGAQYYNDPFAAP